MSLTLYQFMSFNTPKFPAPGGSTAKRGPANLEELKGCTRMVVFNCGDISTKQAYSGFRHHLDESTWSAIKRIKTVHQKNGQSRLDLWVMPNTAGNLNKVFRDNVKQINLAAAACPMGPMPRRSRCNKWRIDFYRSYRERRIAATPATIPSPPKTNPVGIMTFNINGFLNKRTEFEYLLEKENVAICAMQETLVSEGRFMRNIMDFNAFSIPKKEGFRGQMILVKNSLSAYRPRWVSQHILYVKVSGFQGLNRAIHVVSVYLPSGGSRRVERNQQLAHLNSLISEIGTKERDPLILVLGDWNATSEEISKVMVPSIGMEILGTRGSPISRFPKSGSGRAIDHMMVSADLRRYIRKARVEHGYALSDHRPVITQIRKGISEVSQEMPYRLDLNRLKGIGEQLVNDNRWNLLSVDDTEESLDEAAKGLSDTFITIADDLGIRRKALIGRPMMPRKLKSLLDRKYRLAKRIIKMSKKGDPIEEITLELRDVCDRVSKSISAWKKKMEQREMQQTCEDAVMLESKRLWNRVRNIMVSKGMAASQKAHPVMDKDHKLCITTEEILAAVREHYNVLANSDVGHSQDEEYWKSVPIETPRKARLKGINEPISFVNMLMAIRKMKTGTVAGPDEIHVNVLKVLLKTEILEMIKAQNIELERPAPPVGVDFAVSEAELPRAPRTPLGKALLKLVQGVWEREETPAIWNEVHVVNLFKSGSPEDLNNYRGISLMSVGLKIVLKIMQIRMFTALDSRGDIVPEQAGYRPQEEAIAQFIAVTEIVRRRNIDNQLTAGIYIDFKKAFDKVPHEALYRILDNQGIRGRSLNIIKWMYRNSSIKVRVNGKLSEPFPMKRGTRQGCPLSPLLFILFVNNLLTACPTAAAAIRGKTYQGSQYADDLLAFAQGKTVESLKDRVTNILNEIVAWTKKWECEVNPKKSGIVLYSTDADKQREFRGLKYEINGVAIPIVDDYKYLGIYQRWDLGAVSKGDDTESKYQGVDNRHPETGKPIHKSNEQSHAARISESGHKALRMIQPLLRFKKYPLALKALVVKATLNPILGWGGEWIGFTEELASEPQKVLNKAMNLMLGFKGDNKVTNKDILAYELNIPSVNVVHSSARMRMLNKLNMGGFKSLIGKLDKQPFKSQTRTWITQSRAWAASIETKQKSAKWSQRPEAPFRKWREMGLAAEAHNRSNLFKWDLAEDHMHILLDVHNNPSELDQEIIDFQLPTRYGAPSWDDLTSIREDRIELVNKDAISAKCVEDVREHLLERRFQCLERKGAKAFERYDKWNLGVTRDWLSYSVNEYDLQHMVPWVVKARTSCFPCAADLQQMIRRQDKDSEDVDHAIVDVKCPLCGDSIDHKMDWAHLLYACRDDQVVESRKTHLARSIADIERQLLLSRLIIESYGKDGFLDYETLVPIYLIGGSVCGYMSEYTFGFGHLRTKPRGYNQAGWALVAQFFEEVAPRYHDCAQLGAMHGSKIEIDESDSVASGLSPIKWRSYDCLRLTESPEVRRIASPSSGAINAHFQRSNSPSPIRGTKQKILLTESDFGSEVSDGE